MTRPPVIIGLTGGIGSGKSTVAGLLADRGAAVVDADAISRASTAPNGLAIPAIRQAFGDALVDPSGALDRAAMRALVYHDASARHRLEAIIHPVVARESERLALAAQQAGRRCIVHDVPLLVESGARWRSRVDRVLVVDCPPVTQIERVQRRSGLDPAEVERIIAAQVSRSDRLPAADFVVFNGADVSLTALESTVGQLAARFGL